MEQYDYIVIGSGPGGCALSQVLTSDSNITVLMLEAGVNKDHDTPIRESKYALQLENNYYVQYFWTQPQIPQVNDPNLMANYTNGRLRGGSTCINGLQYVRGSKYIYDKWYEITKDKDWSSDSVFATYEAFKDNPISVRVSDGSRISTKFTDAISDALNIPKTDNYNAKDVPYSAFENWQLYQHLDTTRASESTDLIEPILLHRPNFKLITGATATQIEWDKDTRCGCNKPTASAVRYLKKGTSRIAFAKNIIVSAGIQTPLLLQLSGIGPKNILEQYNIPVIRDLPVGCSLYTHLIVSCTFTKNPKDLPPSDPANLYISGAFVPRLDDDRSSPRGSEWIVVDNGDNTLTLLILQLQPFSNGFVRIQSNDPLTVPISSQNAFDNPLDMQFFIECIRTQVVAVSKRLNQIDDKYKLIAPDPVLIDNDQYLTDYILNYNDHAHHWCGQVAMMQCTNSSGKIKGVSNVYVSDDCIAPTIIDGNTAGIAYVIGYTIGRKLLNKH